MKRNIAFALLTLVTIGAGAVLVRQSRDSEVSLRAVGEIAGEVMQDADRVGQRLVKASTAEEEDADLLGIEVGRPVLILSRLVFLANNAPVEYAMDIYRADRTKFKIQTMMSMEDEHARMDKFHQEYDTVLPNLPIGKVK